VRKKVILQTPHLSYSN